jgi:hypothetical protein
MRLPRQRYGMSIYILNNHLNEGAWRQGDS